MEQQLNLFRYLSHSIVVQCDKIIHAHKYYTTAPAFSGLNCVRYVEWHPRTSQCRLVVYV